MLHWHVRDIFSSNARPSVCLYVVPYECNLLCRALCEWGACIKYRFFKELLLNRNFFSIVFGIKPILRSIAQCVTTFNDDDWDDGMEFDTTIDKCSGVFIWLLYQRQQSARKNAYGKRCEMSWHIASQLMTIAVLTSSV